MAKICSACAGIGWVCEDHPDKPWQSCCGAAGMPCGSCNDDSVPELPSGFVNEKDVH